MAVQPLTPERRRELTKTALVEAAADVFAKRGFEGASLEEIAEAAGFSRGAIYSNFGSKEDLMLAVRRFLPKDHPLLYSPLSRFWEFFGIFSRFP